MKVYVGREEWWPIYTIQDDWPQDMKLEIDDELIGTYLAARVNFKAAHAALREAWLRAYESKTDGR